MLDVQTERPIYKAQTNTNEFTENITRWFDLEFTGESTFTGWVKPDVSDFSIGLIVGPSGSGKSLLLKQFGTEETIEWNPQEAVVSHFNTPDDSVTRLMAVGFNDIRAWVRPYHVLSTGQQFRADLARRVKDGAVIDEFTSVVDRNVAKAASKSLRRFVDKQGLKGIVLATCHSDIIQWLRPDWYFDTTDGTLHDGRLLRCPSIEVRIYPCKRSAWSMFAQHHYLSHKLGSSARCFIATATFDGVENVAGFVASLPLPSGTLKNAWREHRTVVLPDFQGLGIGTRLSDMVARVHVRDGKRYYSRTAHPRFGEYRDAHPELWKPTSTYKKGKMVIRNPATQAIKNGFGDVRQCYSHEFIGTLVTPLAEAA